MNTNSTCRGQFYPLVILQSSRLLQSLCLGLQGLSLLGLSLLGWCAILQSPSAQAAPPNIVLILADDLGYSDLGCYGGEIETPHLDGLAHQGLRYTQFYNTARCWPSRSSLLTGYYAQQIRRDNIPGLGGGGNGKRPGWAKLLPQYLAQAAYRSYHSGKWHIDGKVLDGGFASSYQVNNHGNYFSNQRNLLDDQPIGTSTPDEFYTTDATAEHAIRCLQDHAESHPGVPFFSYVAFIAPHFPLHAKPADIAKYAQRYRRGWEEMRDARYARQQNLGLVNTPLAPLEPEIGPPYAFPESMEKLGRDEVNRPLQWDALTPQQQEFQATKMAIHAAMVDSMDQAVGKLIAQLKSMNAYDNTLILFCSDNGASAEIMVRDGGHDPTASPGSAATYLCLGPGFSSACNTPFRRHKTWVHEGGISTPLVVHWPEGIQDPGRLVHTPAHLIDIVPSLLEVARIPQRNEQGSVADRPEFPGRSLVSSFSNQASADRELLWWLHEGNRAIRVGDMKLVADDGQAWCLYDLSRDRAEQNDLASQQPETVLKLEQLWNRELEIFREQAR